MIRYSELFVQNRFFLPHRSPGRQKPSAIRASGSTKFCPSTIAGRAHPHNPFTRSARGPGTPCARQRPPPHPRRQAPPAKGPATSQDPHRGRASGPPHRRRALQTARPGGRMSLSRTVSKPLNPASVIAPRRAAGGGTKDLTYSIRQRT